MAPIIITACSQPRGNIQGAGDYYTLVRAYCMAGHNIETDIYIRIRIYTHTILTKVSARGRVTTQLGGFSTSKQYYDGL